MSANRRDESEIYSNADIPRKLFGIYFIHFESYKFV